MQEVRVKRDCARTNEEFSACDLPDVRKKMPAPVDVMLPICILLSSTGFAELYQELFGWGLLYLLGGLVRHSGQAGMPQCWRAC